MARMSYFEEEIVRNHNNNFMYNMKADDLRRQVKRIMKDVNNNLIKDDHYSLFTNPNLLSCCISESYDQFRDAQAIKNALLSRIKEIDGYVTFNPNMNLHVTMYEERTRCINLLNKAVNKETVWEAAYNSFIMIEKGMDPKTALQNLIILKKSLFYDL